MTCDKEKKNHTTLQEYICDLKLFCGCNEKMTFESLFDTKCFPKEAFVSLLLLLLHAKKAR